MHNVLIRGDGVAARCCGHLLGQAGYRVSWEPIDRPRVPLIMLGEAPQRLIADIFQKDDLFRDLPQIRKRIVAWGAPAMELDHFAVVVSEEVLLDRLGPVASETLEPDWTIFAGPRPEATAEHRFGSRSAAPVLVQLKPEAPKSACWIESLEDGWLFLNSGWLLAVGAEPERLLDASTLIQGQISPVDSPTARFPASPRMMTPLGGDGWISCGSAAMGFDPICGDGTAHAVREAILASAVIRAADSGEDVGALLSHYESRLTAGFQRHLAQCRSFYATGGSGKWWRAELRSVEQGLAWCTGRIDGKFRYRLEGLELKKLLPHEVGRL
jgi:hypothetical protein